MPRTKRDTSYAEDVINYHANRSVRPRVSEATSVADVTYISIAQRRWDAMHPRMSFTRASDGTRRKVGEGKRLVRALLDKLADMGSCERIAAYLTEQQGWMDGYWIDDRPSNMAKVLGHIVSQCDVHDVRGCDFRPGPGYCGQTRWDYIMVVVDPDRYGNTRGLDRAQETCHLPPMVREFCNSKGQH